MASIVQANIATFKAGSAIALGVAVKMGASKDYVVPCTAKTDKSIGISQGVASAAEDKIEIALVGGGAKAKAGGVVALGDMVAPTTDGSLIVTTTANDRVIGIALEDAVLGDIFSVAVAPSNY